jgi:hypothetical protein
MKTGMEYGLIGLVALVALGLLMSVVNAQQVEMAAAQVQATIATAQIPMAATFLGQFGGWLVKFALGVLIAGLAGLLVAWVRSKMRPKSRRAWRNGPNAQWQQREPRERGVTTADLLKLMMMQNGQQPQQGRGQSKNDSDEPKIWR